jgi:hypothetical protein
VVSAVSLLRIVIVIYLQLVSVWSLLGLVFPAIPLLKFTLACSVLLPQFRGEFYLYNLMYSYILKAERWLLLKRCLFSSYLVDLAVSCHISVLRVLIPYISEESIKIAQNVVTSC